jgi:hypothetical protein
MVVVAIDTQQVAFGDLCEDYGPTVAKGARCDPKEFGTRVAVMPVHVFGCENDPTSDARLVFFQGSCPFDAALNGCLNLPVGHG